MCSGDSILCEATPVPHAGTVPLLHSTADQQGLLSATWHSRLQKYLLAMHALVILQLSTALSWAAGVFRAAKCITGSVECISSENPINAQLWPKVLAANSVLVMIAQAFLNMLVDGPATLPAFKLMVMLPLI